MAGRDIWVTLLFGLGVLLYAAAAKLGWMFWMAQRAAMDSGPVDDAANLAMIALSGVGNTAAALATGGTVAIAAALILHYLPRD